MCENVKLVICRVMFYCLESWPGKFAFLSHVSMMVSQNSCYAVAGEVFLFQFAFSVISVVFTVFQLYDCIMGLHLCFKICGWIYRGTASRALQIGVVFHKLEHSERKYRVPEAFWLLCTALFHLVLWLLLFRLQTEQALTDLCLRW